MMRNGNQQMNWRGQNNYINQTGIQNQHSALPGRVIFHPDQIFPQEIPTDGSPAIFPLMDGSCIIVRAIGPNGNLIDEQYALVRKGT